MTRRGLVLSSRGVSQRTHRPCTQLQRLQRLEKIILSDTALRAKAGSGAGLMRRRTTKNMATGGLSIIHRLVLCL